MRILVAVVLCCAMLATVGPGCYRNNLIDYSATQYAIPNYEGYAHHVAWGLANPSGPLDLGAICPTGTARVQVKFNGVSFVASLFTVGIYAPSRVRVWCKNRADADRVEIIDLNVETASAAAEQLLEMARQYGENANIDGVAWEFSVED